MPTSFIQQPKLEATCILLRQCIGSVAEQSREVDARSHIHHIDHLTRIKAKLVPRVGQFKV